MGRHSRVGWPDPSRPQDCFPILHGSLSPDEGWVARVAVESQSKCFRPVAYSLLIGFTSSIVEVLQVPQILQFEPSLDALTLLSDE